MKKPQRVLLVVTIMFLCVMVGIFAGRRTTDGYIPLQNVIGTEDNNEPEHAGDGKVDLNTATIQQLQLLPGVGETIAQRILDYREQIGEFEDIHQLKNVKGIGEKKFEEIKEYIKMEGQDEDSGS